MKVDLRMLAAAMWWTALEASAASFTARTAHLSASDCTASVLLSPGPKPLTTLATSSRAAVRTASSTPLQMRQLSH